MALVNKGVTLGGLGRAEEAIAVYDQVVEGYRADDTPEVRATVAAALVNKGIVLAGLGRAEEAIAVYDPVVEGYGADDTPAVR